MNKSIKGLAAKKAAKGRRGGGGMQDDRSPSEKWNDELTRADKLRNQNVAPYDRGTYTSGGIGVAGWEYKNNAEKRGRLKSAYEKKYGRPWQAGRDRSSGSRF